MKELSSEKLAEYKLEFRALSNRAKYDEAYALALRLMKQYPKEIYFPYMEAVMTAEQEDGFTKAELKVRFRSAAKKIRKLLYRARAMTPDVLFSARNEYYWFSSQPAKQYALGEEGVAAGNPRCHYSRGVGAAQMARHYAFKGNRALCHRWAKKSEAAWLEYFKVMPNWFNSYFFYAAALAYQGRIEEMDAAFAKAAQIAGKPKGWKAIKHQRAEVMEAVDAFEKKLKRKK